MWIPPTVALLKETRDVLGMLLSVEHNTCRRHSLESKNKLLRNKIYQRYFFVCKYLREKIVSYFSVTEVN